MNSLELLDQKMFDDMYQVTLERVAVRMQAELDILKYNLDVYRKLIGRVTVADMQKMLNVELKMAGG